MSVTTRIPAATGLANAVASRIRKGAMAPALRAGRNRAI